MPSLPARSKAIRSEAVARPCPRPRRSWPVMFRPCSAHVPPMCRSRAAHVPPVWLDATALSWPALRVSHGVRAASCRLACAACCGSTPGKRACTGLPANLAPRPPARQRRRLRPRRARPPDRRRDGAGLPCDQGTEVSPLVPRRSGAPVRGRRRDPGPGHAVPGAADRPADDDAGRRGGAAQAQHRRLHAAHLFIGLPVVVVPVPLEPLPIGVQVIAAPWREDVAPPIAHALEQDNAAAGLGRAPI